ncbi:trigger factor [Cupriavidus metallidurans]|uniref:Trigger factor n=1 Tax=Cupriavidus metallidurans (strain ATCC 43123 / DSM 2839 / NBRC 102507 / CH34) TaxID=266264 RepID=TIG_CUPMC|nr:trigger factor [Cupriavidus metallidurans]Q1LM61.1 RecName: Full=Trigger factor; Short=TF; AltName: Full=PPIase [Cupriavidus metallidurans CH34]ABF08765.1 peptidyl-prolyl cis/trans isomerase (trigger factor) [Cupriavidus metallidurans CH34]QGS30315.1 trigger factor [Cupriavidus metallidurans]UBM09640.1 trigger factor [Cupriavidus metallidurans]
MSNVIENLGKLDRKVTLAIPKAEVQKETQERLARLSKTVKMSGFRPGKVPMKMVEKQYGQQVEFEVRFDKAARKFFDITQAQEVKVAGQPKFDIKTEGVADDELAFEATFEVYPEVKIGDLASAEVTRTKTEIGDAEIDKTVDILRKQRVHFHARGDAGAHGDGGADVAAQNGDRVTLDFVGKIDGVEFAGGKAEDFVYVLGEGRMLPEFETATLGLKVGESKSFPLTFPADYHGKEVAGKTAEFTVTLKKVEWAHLPEVDDAFAKSLGIADGSVEKMRADIRENLEREVKRRTHSMLKDQVMEALLKVSELDVPKALVEQDQERLVEMARRDLEQRGMPNAKDMPIPAEMFTQQAERRVKLGLILAEIVKANGLEAKPDQIKAEIEDFAKSYEDPKEVMRWYYGDQQRLAEMEAYVLENNVVNFVCDKAKVADKTVSFEELTAAPAQA